jgi:hypothetical protein
MAKEETRPSSALSPVSGAVKTEASSDEPEAPKPAVKTEASTDEPESPKPAVKTEAATDEPEAPKPSVKPGLKPKDSTAEVIKPNEAPGLKTKPVEEALGGNTHKLKLKPVDKDEKNEVKDTAGASIKSKFAKSLFGSVKAPKSKKK